MPSVSGSMAPLTCAPPQQLLPQQGPPGSVGFRLTMLSQLSLSQACSSPLPDGCILEAPAAGTPGSAFQVPELPGLRSPSTPHLGSFRVSASRRLWSCSTVHQTRAESFPVSATLPLRFSVLAPRHEGEKEKQQTREVRSHSQGHRRTPQDSEARIAQGGRITQLLSTKD